MKYSKELSKIIKEHPIYERLFFIDYKKWKKMKKPGPFWKEKLAFKLMVTPKKLMDTNLKTAYKVCKRFEKRNIESNSKRFYTMISKIVSSKASLTEIDPLA